jgi:phage/plasmid-like protein (TIGR03299 family)
MAHQIDMSNDRANMAFTGNRSAVWHGLGQELAVGASIETWQKEAGLDWEVFESAVKYESFSGEHSFPNKRVLFRSDTKAPLSIVSDDYKIVQPGEVLEFFRDLTAMNKMELSTAGSLFGGKRFWALAKTGRSVEVVGGDNVEAYLLLVTSVDGSLSTQARFTSTRTVCQNTLTIALEDNSKRFIKKSHRSVWDPESVKVDLDLMDRSWANFSRKMKTLAETSISDQTAREYFQDKFFVKGILAEDQSSASTKKVNELMELFRNGTGSEYSHGTAWGIVNAVTELGTHGSGRRDQSHQFWSSYFGSGESMKNEVTTDMIAQYA